MKTMKTSIIASCILLTAGILSAQEYKITVQNNKDGQTYFKGLQRCSTH